MTISRTPSLGGSALSGGTGCHAAAAIRVSPIHHAGVEPAPGHVRAARDLHEIQRVRQPEGEDPQPEQRPGAVQPPARPGDGADHDTAEDQVAEGIRQARCDAQRVAGSDLERGLEDDRAHSPRDCQGGRQPVGAQGDRNSARPSPDEREHPGEHERRHEQVAAIGGRRDGHRLGGPQHPGVVDLAEGPRQDCRLRSGPRPGAPHGVPQLSPHKAGPREQARDRGRSGQTKAPHRSFGTRRCGGRPASSQPARAMNAQRTTRGAECISPYRHAHCPPCLGA